MGKHVMLEFATQPDNHALLTEIAHSFAMSNPNWKNFKGKEVLSEFREFNNWIEGWSRHPGFDFYLMPFSSDPKNPSLRKQWENYCSAEILIKGVPVFNINHPTEELDAILAAKPQKIALTSDPFQPPRGSSAWWTAISKVMVKLVDEKGRPISQIHGVDMLDPTIFSHVPLASADSNPDSQTAVKNSTDRSKPWSLSSRSEKIILMDRIEKHASASFWKDWSQNKNYHLLG